MALSDWSCQVVWIKQMFEELGYQMNSILVCGNNQGSLFIAENLVTKKQSKHILIKYHFVHDAVMMFKQIVLYYISREDNPTATQLIYSQRTSDMSSLRHSVLLTHKF